MNDSAMGDAELRSVLARDAMEFGRLPSRRPDRIVNRPCEGARCAVCQLSLSQGELGYRLEFAENGGYGPAQWLHIRCYDAWDSECRRADTGSRYANGPNGAIKPDIAT